MKTSSWSRLGVAVPVLVVLLMAAGLAWAAGPWGDGVNLSNNPGSSRTPRLAIGSSSTAWAVWMDDTPGAYQILARRGTATGWDATTNVSSVGVDYAKDPAVAVYPTDNKAYFAWSDHRTGNWEIAFRQFDPAGGGTWTPALASDPDNISGTAGLSQSPALAVTPDGTLTAVWADDGHIWFRQRPGTGGDWSAKTDITGPTSTGGDLPSIAVAANGAIFVTWEWAWTNFEADPIQFRNDIAYRSYSAGAWSPALTAAPLNASNSTRLAAVPVVTADVSNTARLVWQSSIFGSGTGETESKVLYRRHNGVTWSAATDVTSAHSLKSYAPWIASTPGGFTYVFWEQIVSTPTGNRDIYYRKLTGDNWGGSPASVNVSANTGLSRNPMVAMRGESPLLAWEDVTGLSEGDIFVLGSFTAPTGLVAGDHPNDAGKAIDLTWTASSDPSVTSYYIVRSYLTGNIWTPWAHETIAGPIVGTTYTDTTVPQNYFTYYYRVRPSDGLFAGTPSATASAQAMVQDSTPPVTGSQIVGTRGTNSRTGLTNWYIGATTVSVTTNETGSVLWNWNGSANNTISPANTDVWYSNPGALPNQGTNTLNYFGVDLVNNLETPGHSVTWYKDTQLPSAPTGVAATPRQSGVVRLVWNNDGADPSPGSGKDHYNVMMGPLGGPRTWRVDSLGTMYETQGVVGNSYEFAIQTEDGAGNKSADSLVATVTAQTFDLNAPHTVSTLSSSGTLGINSRTGPTSWYVGATVPTVALSSNETGTITYNWNGTANTTIASVLPGVWYTNPASPPAQGPNTLDYFGVDESSNVEAPTNTDYFSVDNVNPSAPTGVDVVELEGPGVRVTWNDDGADPTPGSDKDHYNVMMGPVGGPYLWMADLAGGATTYELTPAVKGSTYEFVIQTEDGAGNVSANSTADSVTVLGQPTSLSISAVRDSVDVTSVVYGQSVSLSGYLTNGGGLSGLTVQLQRKYYGEVGWTPLANLVTVAAGRWSYNHVPSKNATYRAIFAGNNAYRSSTSTSVSVKVSVLPKIYSSRYSVRHGSRVRIYGSVAPRHARKYVYIQKKSGTSTWTTIAKVRMNTLSQYGWYLGCSVRRTYVLRTRFSDATDHISGVSRQITVKFF